MAAMAKRGAGVTFDGAPPGLPSISVEAFVAKWRPYEGTESSAYISHFDDLCKVLGHPTPSEADPSQSSFCFQKAVTKNSGQPGFADVFFQRHFGWEYKGNRKDLEEAYQQLLRYRENLASPPLLIVSDFTQFVIRTNFTNTVTKTYRFNLDDLLSGERVSESPFTALELLQKAFYAPQDLNPATTPEKLTEAVAIQFGRVADRLRDQKGATYDEAKREYPRLYSDTQISRFLAKMLFCMFASDTTLLPHGVVTNLIDTYRGNSQKLSERFSALFTQMQTGGDWGTDEIRHFNGGMFEDTEALAMSTEFVDELRKADQQDWSDIEPSIFGTLFERILDPARRKQIGAHYTSRADIELIVRPVLMEPLEREWKVLEGEVGGLSLLKSGPGMAERREKAIGLLQGFLDRLGRVRVLDPACGSGNFLYVSLALLKGLERKVLTAGANWNITGLTPKVHPRQLWGIELDPYAHELASIVVWIGYLQWKRKNGIPFETEDPILEPLRNIREGDAIVERSATGKPSIPVWPEVDVIVGNPPFLGGKKMRSALGDDEVDAIFEAWKGRVKRESDLCCYWFEQAREAIVRRPETRAGLLATQAIRGGANREVLKAIKRSGDIFFAVDDREWVLDGAAVQVSMVGFDDGRETGRRLLRHSNGTRYEELGVAAINSDLTTQTDLTTARRLPENVGLSFFGVTVIGKFDIDAADAAEMFMRPNPHGRSNREVLRLWVNGSDLTGRPRGRWIIDFGNMSERDAALYEAPFAWVVERVKEKRLGNRRAHRREQWWLHGEFAPNLRAAIGARPRYLVTPRVSKYRLFVWQPSSTLPDSATVAFGREDDYFFGVLHSRLHRIWALKQGTQLETRPRYTPTTCFETFPLPWPPGEEPLDDPRYVVIAEAARELDTLRSQRLANDPTMTLTGLYNLNPQWLQDAHATLDRAVFAAYGWDPKLDDGDVLAKLLALNLERSGG